MHAAGVGSACRHAAWSLWMRTWRASMRRCSQDQESPVPAGVLSNFRLVFDAVYTPVWTRLLLDAKSKDCLVRA